MIVDLRRVGGVVLYRHVLHPRLADRSA
jgi:hypothetical protein